MGSDSPFARHSQSGQRNFRVLKRGGVARIMIYQKRSIIGLMLWLRYGLMRFRPWLSLEHIYTNYLESPWTKAYTPDEAAELFSQFENLRVSSVLTHGDLLTSDAGQRHRGILLSTAKRLWPRALIRRVAPKVGLFLMITAKKQSHVS